MAAVSVPGACPEMLGRTAAMPSRTTTSLTLIPGLNPGTARAGADVKHTGVTKMITLKSLFDAAALVAVSTLPIAAKPLPACDDGAVKQTFLKIVQPWQLYELKAYGSGNSGTDKRWCYAYFAGAEGLGVPRARTPFMEAVFTLEWMNEADNRWWLQIRQSGKTCRGVIGDPMSNQRCK
jgi:hypothetical protein